MTTQHLKVERLDVTARVVLNRPDVRNAFDSTLIRELHETFAWLAKDAKLRAIVLAGEGQHFCAGADVNWMKSSLELTTEQNRTDAQALAEMLRAIDECPVPVVGRIHGAALGGGSGLAAACDIVVAAEDARFGFTEVRLGILPAVISTFVLPKIGPTWARRYFLTGEVFTATVARDIGLVHEVVTPANLDAAVGAIVTSLVQNSPQAVREAKALIRAVMPLPRDQAVAVTVDTIARVRTSPEGQEGLRAFLEKRDPEWRVK